MRITILFGGIPLFEVIAALLEDGIVVLETSRVHAKEIVKNISEALEIDPEPEEGPSLIHLATEVPDRGWSDFVMYSKKYEYKPDFTQQLVVKAVLEWVQADCPDKFITNV
ncbi:hypothetical protein [Geobacter anodireducens]|uniref:Uncharacterized protein n=1 Tax=Geobacter soli TaxID=1510391 RepID=A0A0C1QPD4_9BACT|nr:hypothetical protein [Geobacter soli]KIE42457.1 hypothetical protein SE37_07345 [Geobacter soli]